MQWDVKDLAQWHTWFAWIPVVAQAHPEHRWPLKWVWWETVVRRQGLGGGYIYRIVNTQEQGK